MSENTYVVYHLHDDTTNADGFADSCSKYTEYIDLAKKQGMTAIAFSNHGTIYDWIKKKQACDKAGIKYIHGVEAYVCTELTEDDRGAHIGLYAKNWDGVMELNQLVSVSTKKGVAEDHSDRHFYYHPRISLHELMSTSDNIIITSACLASPLSQWDTPLYRTQFQKLVRWMMKNKHRCFFEIQYHNDVNQIALNRKLYKLSQYSGVPLIAGTDTHSSSAYKAECRKILQKYKDVFYGDEDAFDLTWKTYDELVAAFKKQNAVPEDVYLQAIQNTNALAAMVESFDLDKTFKYPDLYGDNVRDQWWNLIQSCFEDRKKQNALKLPSKIKKECMQYFAEHRHIDPQDTTEIAISKTQKGLLDWANRHTDDEILSQYQNQIKEEFDVMCKLGMESFMMFMSELITWAKNNNIPCGTGRGSVCGSVVAFITQITDVDPLVWDTVFSRFCNADRISLGDIDVDFAGEDRERVYQYIIDRFTPEKTAYITTFSTLQDRGCIDVLAGGLGYEDLDKVMDIKNHFDEYYTSYSKLILEEVNIDELVESGKVESSSPSFDHHAIYIERISNEESKKRLEHIKRQYDLLISANQDLFYYLKGLKGTIVAKGVHASGIIGSPITLSDHLGLYYRDGDSNMPVSTCAMKAVDSLNYVKFDILGLKTVGLIKDACAYAGIPYPQSHLLNWNDAKVWRNMIEAQQAVFQFESDFAFSLLKDFKPTTINHMSMVNAALRPSGKSYRNRLIAGEKNKNPSEEIDHLLESNNGYLIFQEDTIKFLTDICGFTGSAADTTRRAIGKKDKELLKQQLPKILEGYCNHSSKERSVAEEEAKQFVQIIQDSSEYQFGKNHSTAYSMNGYECVWLRTYYPLEFVAAYMNRAENKIDINFGVDLAKKYNITVNPIKFGKSLGEYTLDRKHNAIYKGIASIKYCGEDIASQLMQVAQDKKYDSFIDLLDAITEKTKVDARQMKILTALDFFSMFGQNQYLLDLTKLYKGVKIKDPVTKNMKQVLPALRTCKTIKKDNLDVYEEYGITEAMIERHTGKETPKQYTQIDNVGLLKDAARSIPNRSMSLRDYLKFEKDYLQYVTYYDPKSRFENRYVVTDLKTYKNATKPYLTLMNIKTGEEIKTKITQSKIYVNNPFSEFDILEIDDFATRKKRKFINGQWTVSDETEPVLELYRVVDEYEDY